MRNDSARWAASSGRRPARTTFDLRVFLFLLLVAAPLVASTGCASTNGARRCSLCEKLSGNPDSPDSDVPKQAAQSVDSSKATTKESTKTSTVAGIPNAGASGSATTRAQDVEIAPLESLDSRVDETIKALEPDPASLRPELDPAPSAAAPKSAPAQESKPQIAAVPESKPIPATSATSEAISKADEALDDKTIGERPNESTAKEVAEEKASEPNSNESTDSPENEHSANKPNGTQAPVETPKEAESSDGGVDQSDWDDTIVEARPRPGSSVQIKPASQRRSGSTAQFKSAARPKYVEGEQGEKLVPVSGNARKKLTRPYSAQKSKGRVSSIPSTSAQKEEVVSRPAEDDDLPVVDARLYMRPRR